MGIFDVVIKRSVVSLFIMQYVLCVSCNIRIVGIIVSIMDMSVSMHPIKGVWIYNCVCKSKIDIKSC